MDVVLPAISIVVCAVVASGENILVTCAELLFAQVSIVAADRYSYQYCSWYTACVWSRQEYMKSPYSTAILSARYYSAYC